MDLSVLPDILRKKSVILSGEAAWPREVAQSVINFLLQNGYAVVGVELWLPEGNAPRVVGWSDYTVKFSGNWDEYVQLNAQHAMQELDKSGAEAGLYNLTWINQGEFDLDDNVELADLK